MQRRQRQTFKVFSPTNKQLFLKNNPKAQSLILVFLGAADDITDLKKRLKNADEKKKALQKELVNAQNKLNDIKRGRTSQGIIALAGLFN